MRLYELEGPGTTVCLFKGMHTEEGNQGNSSLEQIAQLVGGQVFEGKQSAEAARYYHSRPGTLLVVVGYSLGAEGVLGMQALRPALSITIAGWPTTLEQLASVSQGTWHNFFQQQELDGILQRNYNRGPYKPGGIAHPVDARHGAIVGTVSSQVVSLIKQVGTSTPTPHPNASTSRADRLAKFNESQRRGKNF